MSDNEILLAQAESRHVDDISDLVFSTGASVYGYIFGHDRKLFDPYIRRSWNVADSFYSKVETTIATANDQLLGIEIGYGGERYHQLKSSGTEVAAAMLESGETTPEDMKALGIRSYKNNFQIPYVPDEAYYIMALAVKEESRGTGLGAKLLSAAIERARENGYRTLHLDVISDNPAVDFYKRMGLTCMAESSVPELRQHHGVPMEYRMVIHLEQ